MELKRNFWEYKTCSLIKGNEILIKSMGGCYLTKFVREIFRLLSQIQKYRYCCIDLDVLRADFKCYQLWRYITSREYITGSLPVKTAICRLTYDDHMSVIILKIHYGLFFRSLYSRMISRINSKMHPVARRIIVQGKAGTRYLMG